jgi:hypothetical protein
MLKALRHHPLLVGVAEVLADAVRYVAIMLLVLQLLRQASRSCGVLRSARRNVRRRVPRRAAASPASAGFRVPTSGAGVGRSLRTLRWIRVRRLVFGVETSRILHLWKARARRVATHRRRRRPHRRIPSFQPLQPGRVVQLGPAASASELGPSRCGGAAAAHRSRGHRPCRRSGGPGWP